MLLIPNVLQKSILTINLYTYVFFNIIFLLNVITNSKFSFFEAFLIS
jgi:hypothetical protein